MARRGSSLLITALAVVAVSGLASLSLAFVAPSALTKANADSTAAAAPEAAHAAQTGAGFLQFDCVPALALPLVMITGGLAATRRRKQTSEQSKLRARHARGAWPEYTSMCKDEPADHVHRKWEDIITKAQDAICTAIQDLDGGAKFEEEVHDRPNGGGGRARVLRNGNMFEKAGVNVSVIYGEMPPEALNASTEKGAERIPVKLEPGQKVPFFAAGISSVMHPKNPFCPTMHFNYRYFETAFGTWWFGGGTDITPSYLDREDMKHFHGTYKQVCDKYDESWYPKFKDWADRYFHIKHRGETRGLGGIFFDDFNTLSLEEHMKFSQECLAAVTKAYIPILEKNQNHEFTETNKAWQQVRRGRYVEFNLVYDRGTIFGLKMLPTGAGRIESILMSLPETARWEYNFTPTPGSPEAEITEAFRVPQTWV